VEEEIHLVKIRGHFCPKLVQNICFRQKYPFILIKWIYSISLEMKRILLWEEKGWTTNM
jgi:hypothetical protein